MNKPRVPNDLWTPLPVVVVSWLGFLVVLLGIDLMLFRQPVFPMMYYLINGLAALSILFLSRRRRTSVASDQTLIPLAIVLLSLLPILTGTLMTSDHPAMPASGPESIALRQMPLLLLGLVMVTWRYRLGTVMLYGVGVSALGLAIGLAARQGGGDSPPLYPVAILMLIQATSFVVVGYFMHGMFERLAAQHASLERAHARLLDYAQAQEELTISQERNRMARELHDTLAHTLSALTVHLETTRAYMDVDPAAAADLLDTGVATARSGLDDTRRALKALRASPLQDMGLSLALRQLVTDVAERAGFYAEANVSQNLPVLPEAVEHCIYRVAQEALANVSHHANAETVVLTLEAGEEIVLTVTDDGLGFDPGQAVSGHYGLAGMRERADLVGGTLLVQSSPGTGSTVQLAIPLSEEEA